MRYAIHILEQQVRAIESTVRDTGLVQKDRARANAELSKVTTLKKAIKLLKLKEKRP